MFHSARIIGAVLLLAALYIFITRTLKEVRYQNLGYAVCALGSGLGWLAVLFNMFTSDFWVAEAYPFLSMYTNPHFSFGLALMVFALMPGRKKKIVFDLLMGLGLGIIQPFAVVIVLLVKTGTLIASNLHSFKNLYKERDFISTVAFGIGGGLILIYQYWSILTDPVLSLWNSQNITASPGYLDLLISFSPCLVLACFGVKRGWQEDRGKFLIIWAVASLGLMLVPWNLQRRFLTGIYIPFAVLSVFGIEDLVRSSRIRFRSAAILLLILVIPTNIMVLASGFQAAAIQDESIFYDRGIQNGLAWIAENAKPDDLVLARSEIGTIIPAITGRRVIYGHPFETVDAVAEKQFLKDFFEMGQDDDFYNKSFLERDIDILFLTGDNSENLESWIKSKGMKLGYQNELVRIFLVKQQ